MASTFGPQSANLVTTRPAADTVVTALDTFFKDCTSATSADGTVVTASWLNMVTAQLREAVVQSGQTPDDSIDTQLWLAMKGAARSAIAATRGVTSVTAGTTETLEFSIGLGILTNYAYTALDPLFRMNIWDNAANVVGETTLYAMIRNVIGTSTGVTYNATTGDITIGANTKYSQSTAPTAPVLGDHWYSTTDDILYEYTDVGASSIWLAIA